MSACSKARQKALRAVGDGPPDLSNAEKFAYFFGTVTPICPMWYVFTIVGAVYLLF